MLIQYIRFSKKEAPIGAIVAIARKKIGCSICSPKDRFNRAVGRNLAAGRAVSGEFPEIKNKKVLELIDQYWEIMKERAKHYYKKDN